jgi:NAD(P) transhydrogenase subunit alpha
VIVDLAAANGGNCAYTEANKVITTPNGVKVIGYTDMVGRLPTQSSQLYGTNLVNLLKLLCKEKDGNINIDFEDEVLRGLTVIKEGEITWPAPAIKVSAAPQQPAAEIKPKVVVEKVPMSPVKKYGLMAAGIAAFGWIANYAPAEFLAHLTVFVLACVVGYYVVWNVSHALHTPLMSVTNAISGIIIVGAVLQVSQGSSLVTVLAFIAVLIASINIFGGFTVTKRMLEMFRKDK